MAVFAVCEHGNENLKCAECFTLAFKKVEAFNATQVSTRAVYGYDLVRDSVLGKRV